MSVLCSQCDCSRTLFQQTPFAHKWEAHYKQYNGSECLCLKLAGFTPRSLPVPTEYAPLFRSELAKVDYKDVRVRCIFPSKPLIFACKGSESRSDVEVRAAQDALADRA